MEGERKWIERRIEKCGFVLDIDFRSKLSETSSTGGRPTKEYEITIGMAKELCMLERNDMGKEARLHFIEIERRYKDKPQLSATDMFLQAAKALKEQDEKLNNLHQRLSIIENEKKEATEKLLAMPESDIKPKEKTIKAMIRERLNSYAHIKKNYPECWRQLYKQMYYRYQVNVNLRTIKGKKNGLDVLGDLGLLKEAYAVACEIFIV